jgi:hypothetical protein
MSSDAGLDELIAVKELISSREESCVVELVVSATHILCTAVAPPPNETPARVGSDEAAVLAENDEYTFTASMEDGQLAFCSSFANVLRVDRIHSTWIALSFTPDPTSSVVGGSVAERVDDVNSPPGAMLSDDEVTNVAHLTGDPLMACLFSSFVWCFSVFWFLCWHLMTDRTHCLAEPSGALRPACCTAICSAQLLTCAPLSDTTFPNRWIRWMTRMGTSSTCSNSRLKPTPLHCPLRYQLR